MSPSKIRRQKNIWIPASLAIALRHRCLELCGLVLLVIGGAFAAALVSFDPADPSRNHIVDRPPANVLGHTGASIADLVLTTIGLASAVLIVAIVAWGLRLILRHRPPGPAWRIALLLLSVPLMAIVVAAVAPPSAWPLTTGLGGLIGDGGAARLAALAAAEYTAATPALVALVLAVPALAALLLGVGANASELRTAGRSLAAAAATCRSAFGVAHGFVRRQRARFGQRRQAPAPTAARTALDPIETPASPAGEPAPPADPEVAAPAPRMRSGRKAQSSLQGALNLGETGYRPPPIDLLVTPPTRLGNDIDRDALQQNARLLSTVLEDFGVRGEIVKVRPGPVITLYELEPAPGTKSSRVIGLADDIARSMSAVSVRVAVVPGRNVIGIELPNQRRETVYLRELLASEAFERSKGHLTLALGKDIGGGPVFVDLARMPHLLIAGTTGSGKSVAINTMILSLVFRLPPETCKLILIDPKMLELSVYDGIPHLLSPVVTEPAKAVLALKWAVREMEERYRLMSQLGVRNIAGFNARVAEAQSRGETLVRRVQTGFDDDGRPVIEDQPLETAPLPFIVIVVDEMADLMLVAGKDIEAAIQRLAQMARAAGIHLIMATQRPSVDVITGTIKANFPTRVSFQVTSKIDSRTILGEQGAEQLLGMGDMLHMAGGGRLTRVHGPFVTDEEVEAVVRALQEQGEPSYLPEVTEECDTPAWDEDGGEFGGQSGDALYDEAVAIVARDRKASTSYVQRRMQIGYNRAARLIERMEAEGVVSKPDRVGRREVLVGDHSG
jgi:DNA segregation ATPase FtsK/SpoIIIE, S-DNA-T family